MTDLEVSEVEHLRGKQRPSKRRKARTIRLDLDVEQFLDWMRGGKNGNSVEWAIAKLVRIVRPMLK